MKFWLLIFVLLLAPVVHATTYTSPTCNYSDVQATVNLATSLGDTVIVNGPCTTSWASYVGIPANQAITFQCVGMVTVTTGGVFFYTNASAETTVTGCLFQDSNRPIGIGTCGGAGQAACGGNPATTYTFRITNCTFSNTIPGSIFIGVSGGGPGLIDHNTFTGGAGSEYIHNLGMGPAPPDSNGWLDNVIPGGSQMLFIEANTFNNASATTVVSMVEGYYGARTVVRYNQMNFAQVDMHGGGGIGARWWEVYNNTFTTPMGLTQFCVEMRDGTGVVFNNVSNGAGAPCNFNVTNDNSSSAGQWPYKWQVGSGINGYTINHSSCSGPLNSAPAYFWGTSENAVTTTSNATMVLLNRDYFVSLTQPASMHWQESSTDTCSTTYNYTPYTYPHPLDTTGIAISPPSFPGGTIGVSYLCGGVACTLTASGGTAPYTWLVTSGSLPAGLSLNTSTGVISGTPTTANTYTFTIQATDSTSPTPLTGTQTYNITISGAPSTILTVPCSNLCLN